jgi:phage-related baseplate assembly protein
VSSYTAIDLSALPPPQAIEPLDFEAVLLALRADLAARDPDLLPVLSLESEPINKLLEACAYREILLRARVNDAARAVMLAFATGADLEHLGALFGVSRLVVQAADLSTSPPTLEILETDTALRARIQLALEGYTVAGSVGAYEYHARSADGRVIDVDVFAPGTEGGYTGRVEVTLLSSEDATGEPSGGLISIVSAALNADHVRPLTDYVVVQAPSAVIEYTVTAALSLYAGPSSAVVVDAAEAALDQYIADRRKLGHDVTRSGIFAALHQPGVQNVVLTSPAADVVVDHNEVAQCTGIALTTAGTAE